MNIRNKRKLQATGPGGYLSYGFITFLNQHPLTPTLNELIKHQAHISQCEPADVEAEELSRVSCAEFQTNVGFG